MPPLYLKNMNRIEKLQKHIDISFKNPSILDLALTHSSFNREHNNERLCFLGDAVLNMIAAHYLFKRFPKYREGVLTKMRAGLISRKVLELGAKHLNLGDLILLSKAEEKTGGRKKASVLSEAIEGLIGAIFIDSGICKARKFVMKYLFSKEQTGLVDYKSALQEFTQKKKGTIPIYKLIKKSGKEHNPLYTISVSADGMIEKGRGKNKKQAEQEAAKRVLERLQREENYAKTKNT